MIIHNLFFYFFFFKNNKHIVILKKWVSEYQKKRRSGLLGECFYFVGNVLVQVRHIFLPDYLLILSLLELRGVGYFGTKTSGLNRGSPLNSTPYNL